MARIACLLNLTEEEFVHQFMRLRSDRKGLVLADKPNGECVFLDGKNCRVQPVKPQQCRDFPNLWNLPGVEKVCQAIPREISATEFRERIETATGMLPNEPITPS